MFYGKMIIKREPEGAVFGTIHKKFTVWRLCLVLANF
jgi:hypothetical protein